MISQALKRANERRSESNEHQQEVANIFSTKTFKMDLKKLTSSAGTLFSRAKQVSGYNEEKVRTRGIHTIYIFLSKLICRGFLY